MLTKLSLTSVLILLTIGFGSMPDPAYAVEEEKVQIHLEGIEIKANLGHALMAVYKKDTIPVFIPIVIDEKYTQIDSPSIKKGLWLKPRDVVDLWAVEVVDGFYVAQKIFLWKRPTPTAEDIKRGGISGRSKRMDHFSLVPEDIEGLISKVVVDTKYQNVYVYGPDKDVWFISRCVTGKLGWHIPKGNYRIRTKQRNRYLDGEQFGEDYHFWVNYWMLFYGEAGLHDASWRNTFWIDHRYHGSHGCINLPLATARFIYKHSKIGTPVHVR